MVSSNRSGTNSVGWIEDRSKAKRKSLLSGAVLKSIESTEPLHARPHIKQPDQPTSPTHSFSPQPDSVWVDKDDHARPVGPVNAQSIQVAASKKLRKLRKTAKESSMSISRYESRLRDYYVTEASRRAPGTWARLSPSKQKTQRYARQRASPAPSHQLPPHRSEAHHNLDHRPPVSFRHGYLDPDDANGDHGDDESKSNDGHDNADESADEYEYDSLVPNESLQAVIDEDETAAGVNASTLNLQDHVRKLKASTGTIISAVEDRALGARALRQGIIDIRRVANANRVDPNKAVVRSVQFHPSGKLLLTAGLDKTLRIFHVDGKSNPKVQGVHLPDMPIHSAHFITGGDAIVLAGRRRYVYRFDLESGTVHKVQTIQCGEQAEKSLERMLASCDGSRLAVIGTKGRVLMLCAKSMHQTGLLRADADCESATFAADNAYHLYTASRGGTVCLWDVRRHGCVDRHVDEGSIHCTALASSPGHYAVGSDSGVVNIYGNPTLGMKHVDDGPATVRRIAKPERSLLNLTTKVTTMAFNCDGRILAIASENLKNAVRLVHIPSLTVYGNWPSSATNLRRIFAMAFSPRGEYLALGNDKGHALLFRIRNGYPL